jgi:hypothetical protein
MEKMRIELIRLCCKHRILPLYDSPPFLLSVIRFYFFFLTFFSRFKIYVKIQNLKFFKNIAPRTYFVRKL